MTRQEEEKRQRRQRRQRSLSFSSSFLIVIAYCSFLDSGAQAVVLRSKNNHHIDNHHDHDHHVDATTSTTLLRQQPQRQRNLLMETVPEEPEWNVPNNVQLDVPHLDDVALECSSSDNKTPTLHILPPTLLEDHGWGDEEDINIAHIQQLHEYSSTFENISNFYSSWLAPSKRREGPNENYVELQSSTDGKVNAEFILWGPSTTSVGFLDASAHTTDGLTVLETNPNQRNQIWSRIHFYSHKSKDVTKVERVWEFDDGNNYAIFAIFHHGVFAHFLIDYLPYIAYMKEALEKDTTLLFVDVDHKMERLLTALDPEFVADRVKFIQCSSQDPQNLANNKPQEDGLGKDGSVPGLYCYNQLVRVSNGGSLKVMIPQQPIRNMANFIRAREWIFQKHPPPPASESQQRTIIYYSRNNPTAGNGRAMNQEQEYIMIEMIQRMMEHFNRPEQLVVFDGSQHTFVEQIQLFQSANVVIGPHGGGMANLLFLPSSSECNQRPKVLEFVASSRLSDDKGRFQNGAGLLLTYYVMYATIPWVDYHHILYTPPTDRHETYVNLKEFQLALHEILKT